MLSTNQLIQGLQAIPQTWALTPVRGDKKPYRDRWQKEAPLALAQIVTEIKSDRALGYGLRTGAVSGGILAIDADGHAAEKLLQELSGGDLPDTVIFASGKPGRSQRLYQVPQEYWTVIKTTKLKTGARGSDGKEQQLEFRWDGCQSVLPPSAHPETNGYKWVKSPSEIPVANCPVWVIELMLDKQTTPVLEPVQPVSTTAQPVSTAARPPLSIFLGRADKELIESGIGDGARNDAAQKLSLNLVATARRLYELGIDYEGDPRTLYDQFCGFCTPPLGSDVKGENEGWWRKADAHAKRPSLDDGKLQGCYEAWVKRQERPVQQSTKTGENKLQKSMPIVNGEAVYSEDERLRLALLDLAQEKNSIARVRKRAQICSYYRISKSEIESLIKEMEEKTIKQGLQRNTLDDLLDMVVEEINWLIPELLPRGELIVLGGSPKAGKTLMAIDAAFAIATGEDDFLGIKCDRGKVLLISNDENPRSTKSKLLKRGFRPGDGEWLEIIFNWTIDRLYELEQVLDEFRPDVVIIDSLKSITVNSDISENSAEFANNIYALKNLFNQYKAAAILIHHTNKNKDAMGIAKLRGSSAIAGAVWGTWQLEHIPKPDPEGKGLIIDPADPNRVLSAFTRDIEGQLLKLEFDPENNSYARTDKEIIKEQTKLRDRIMFVLKINPHGLTGREIVECLGLTQDQKHPIYTELTRMEAKRLVSTVKSTRDKRITIYTLKQLLITDEEKLACGDSLSPNTCDLLITNMVENHIQQELQNSNQETQNSNQLAQNSNQTLVDYQNSEADYYLKPLPVVDKSDGVINYEVSGGGGCTQTADNYTESQELLDQAIACDEVQDEVGTFALLQIEIDGDVNGFIGCQVEVRGLSDNVKFVGTLVSYEQLNGCVVVRTDEGVFQIAHVRETFVVN